MLASSGSFVIKEISMAWCVKVSKGMLQEKITHTTGPWHFGSKDTVMLSRVDGTWSLTTWGRRMAVVVALGVSRSSTSPGSEVGTLSKVLILALRNSVSMLKSLREEGKAHLVVFHGAVYLHSGERRKNYQVHF